MAEATLIHRWFEEVWNQKSEAAVDEMFASGRIAHGIVDETGNELCGPKGFKKLQRQFLETFPDMHIEV